ncbi:MAG TPA: TetR/AcrR family transcriptional regulator [Vicinamibacterales bacterium]
MSRLRRAYHHGDLRATLLGEVEGIIREQGIGVVSIREVARRARVSHAAPAHHFGNKSGLLTAFAVQGYERLAEMVQAMVAAARATSPPDVLAAMGRAYVTFAVDNPEHFGVMFPGDLLDQQDPAYITASDRCFGPLVDVVRRAEQEGYLMDDPMLVAASAWSIVHGLASLWLSGRVQARTGVVDADAIADAVTRLFVDRVMGKKL